MKEYLEPEIDIEKFQIEDILTTSNPGVEKPGDVDDGMGWA